MVTKVNCDAVDRLLAVSLEPVPQSGLYCWYVNGGEESVAQETIVMVRIV